jgi:hypothetical protein
VAVAAFRAGFLHRLAWWGSRLLDSTNPEFRRRPPLQHGEPVGVELVLEDL